VYETNDDQASNHVNQKQNQERLSPASISRDPHRPRSDESPGAENCAHTAQCEHGKSRKDPRCLRKGKTGDSVQRNRQKASTVRLRTAWRERETDGMTLSHDFTKSQIPEKHIIAKDVIASCPQGFPRTKLTTAPMMHSAPATGQTLLPNQFTRFISRLPRRTGPRTGSRTVPSSTEPARREQVRQTPARGWRIALRAVEQRLEHQGGANDRNQMAYEIVACEVLNQSQQAGKIWARCRGCSWGLQRYSSGG